MIILTKDTKAALSGGWGQRWGLTKALLKCDLIKCMGKRPTGQEEDPAVSPCPPWAAVVGGGHQSHSLPVSRRLAWGVPGATPGSCHMGPWGGGGADLGGAMTRGQSSKNQMVAYTTQKPVVLPFWSHLLPLQLWVQSSRCVSYPWVPQG